MANFNSNLHHKKATQTTKNIKNVTRVGIADQHKAKKQGMDESIKYTAPPYVFFHIKDM